MNGVRRNIFSARQAMILALLAQQESEAARNNTNTTNNNNNKAKTNRWHITTGQYLFFKFLTKKLMLSPKYLLDIILVIFRLNFKPGLPQCISMLICIGIGASGTVRGAAEALGVPGVGGRVQGFPTTAQRGVWACGTTG